MGAAYTCVGLLWWLQDAVTAAHVEVAAADGAQRWPALMTARRGATTGLVARGTEGVWKVQHALMDADVGCRKLMLVVWSLQVCFLSLAVSEDTAAAHGVDLILLVLAL